MFLCGSVYFLVSHILIYFVLSSEPEMQNVIKKTLHIGHATYPVSLQVRLALTILYFDASGIS